jgi:hypothetical protein
VLNEFFDWQGSVDHVPLAPFGGQLARHLRQLSNQAATVVSEVVHMTRGIPDGSVGRFRRTVGPVEPPEQASAVRDLGATNLRLLGIPRIT